MRLFSEGFVNEFEEGFGGGVVWFAEVVVEFVVGGLAAAEGFCGDAGCFQGVGEAAGLGAGVGVFGDVEDEEGRYPLPFGNVSDGGIVFVFGGVVAEFLAVAIL